MGVKLKNAIRLEMLHQLEPLLPRRDKIGYVAARNYRVLSNSLTEYMTFRRDLIEKYGEPITDENGAETGRVSIKIGSPEFKSFNDEMAPFSEMEHEVELMTIKYDEVIGNLTGEEILGIDWMLED